jgi:hypothetical protein
MMKEQTTTLLKSLKSKSITFKDVLELIDTYYQHQPTAFKNGDVYNEASQTRGAPGFSLSRR